MHSAQSLLKHLKKIPSGRRISAVLPMPTFCPRCGSPLKGHEASAK